MSETNNPMTDTHMTDTKADGSYALVNGLNLYYEIHGTGRPVVMIHGGLGVGATVAPYLFPLAPDHQSIVVELQAHGHTADVDRPFSFEQLADDVAALIRHLGLATVDVIGHSLGGSVALQLAIRHPNVVRRLVVVSAPFRRSGWYPEVLAGMASIPEVMLNTPMYEAYARVAPRPQDFPNLIRKTKQLLGQDYDWSAGVTSIQSPVLIVAGDADSLRPSHAVEMFELLGGGKADGASRGLPKSQLAILPATTHFNILTRSDLPAMITLFLDAES